MIIKKFLGKTEAEAVENAKKELGTGIVIMNVKNVKKKGLFSFLKREKVEVTVALEEEGEKQKIQPGQQPKAEATAKQPAAPIKPVDLKQPVEEGNGRKEESAVIEEKLNSLQSLLEKQLMNAAFMEEKERKKRKRKRKKRKKKKRKKRKWIVS